MKNTNSGDNKNSSTTLSIADVFTKRSQTIKGSIEKGNIEQIESDGTSYQLLSPSRGEHSKLLEAIPEGRKYNVMRKLAYLLIENDKVDNSSLAQAIHPTVLGQRGKLKRLAKRDYNQDYHQEIKNRFVALKRRWKPLKYTITLRQEYSKLIPIR